mmetsp:Transcript_7040/g.10753  ORF Transcript_7040/g.10753 Transcript_7040/m.10753 type:complete len:231 (+) Transcript_7040:536-1228(+)
MKSSNGKTEKKKKLHNLKIALIGDAQIGKTSLMVKYIKNNYDEDYIQTLGVNFMEKKIELKNATVMFSVWDLGGQKQYVEMMPLVCNDAKILAFAFDLTRPSTLASVRAWYIEARKLNKKAIPFLIGTKYDDFKTMQFSHQQEMTKQARKFAKAMKSSLAFTSAKKGINVAKIFKAVITSYFQIKAKFQEVSQVGAPIFELYSSSDSTRDSNVRLSDIQKVIRSSSTTKL